ncbi:MAG: 2-oxoacid:acceptor oxidoreductase family protein [Candidatus Nanoarchaeia archaeon]|nr:2-oxoacid:acceptor oxidoreductase family protein [Candidatus Haiyanarchaeum thermophilum]MCW1303190.1 2-oxoacid:acceptor oxidoreductase family protein [Candidatus Haiyanarchaeum thermophilum]MCW1303856.1 2-oxoacid:acceptor oxidoreductase family protein [Candidatus Haiyanarchaeum thermophilum]MCW1306528.1 2-oxoacid:acceptor oxidoreductase family protein [Candidatus Haiyanarchaeum thermophilum]MCW1306941.1 2-oxoacid:acceptor oxidoreductase family protein [Candidatus Haiyanarchaeum thermophilum
MIEVKISGLAGQGCVTLASLIAKAAFLDGKYAQAFPFFGAERRGMPVEAYCRIDEEEILLRMPIENPDYVLVLDEDLVDEKLIGPLDKRCLIIVNGRKAPENLGLSGFRSIVVDLYSIAQEVFRAPIVNTAMLGAFAAASNAIKFQSACSVLREAFPGELAEKNELACMRAYELVRKNLLIGKYFL